VASTEEAAAYRQTPVPGQRVPLQTDRQVSSIPRGGTAEEQAAAPRHQDGSSQQQKWVYPSEQQLYNAMLRKGWSNVPAESIPTVLQIHNHINERTWTQIQEWEGRGDLALAKFQGRPRDLSPKAFLCSSLLRISEPPFDRHDWYVQSGGTVQRYVIDYYYVAPPFEDMPPIPYVDARPALDHPRAVYLRAKRFVQLALPGITAHVKQLMGGEGPNKETRANPKAD
jgi:hypothetical protein